MWGRVIFSARYDVNPPGGSVADRQRHGEQRASECEPQRGRAAATSLPPGRLIGHRDLAGQWFPGGVKKPGSDVFEERERRPGKSSVAANGRPTTGVHYGGSDERNGELTTTTRVALCSRTLPTLTPFLAATQEPLCMKLGKRKQTMGTREAAFEKSRCTFCSSSTLLTSPPVKQHGKDDDAATSHQRAQTDEVALCVCMPLMCGLVLI